MMGPYRIRLWYIGTYVRTRHHALESMLCSVCVANTAAQYIHPEVSFTNVIRHFNRARNKKKAKKKKNGERLLRAKSIITSRVMSSPLFFFFFSSFFNFTFVLFFCVDFLWERKNLLLFFFFFIFFTSRYLVVSNVLCSRAPAQLLCTVTLIVHAHLFLLFIFWFLLLHSNMNATGCRHHRPDTIFDTIYKGL